MKTQSIIGIVIGVAIVAGAIIWFTTSPEEIITEERVEAEIERIEEEIREIRGEAERKMKEGEVLNGDYILPYFGELDGLDEDIEEVLRKMKEAEISLQDAWKEIERINENVERIRRAVEVWG